MKAHLFSLTYDLTLWLCEVTSSSLRFGLFSASVRFILLGIIRTHFLSLIRNICYCYRNYPCCYRLLYYVCFNQRVLHYLCSNQRLLHFNYRLLPMLHLRTITLPCVPWPTGYWLHTEFEFNNIYFSCDFKLKLYLPAFESEIKWWYENEPREDVQQMRSHLIGRIRIRKPNASLSVFMNVNWYHSGYYSLCTFVRAKQLITRGRRRCFIDLVRSLWMFYERDLIEAIYSPFEYPRACETAINETVLI